MLTTVPQYNVEFLFYFLRSFFVQRSHVWCQKLINIY